MSVFHDSPGLVEPQSNTLQGSWRYQSSVDSSALCLGFYWMYRDDKAQLYNSTEVMKAVVSSRCNHYQAIEAEHRDCDNTTTAFSGTFARPVRPRGQLA